ncbi:MAG: hypothetical protein A3G51_02160 [Candidatus Yanofskybacteria bacterium RIFCSPLOWO2_12_FULL_43_11b]|uniref:Chaperone protein DnaJ n=1 Tax=Candidatus Yanofskybacteria bacterium RIFCSPLOWO2_12_FULL_43_11b TaxID=1802710 RepID=A0A1F8H8E9_9BACT|nr:MAG: hypothetical protein A2742_01385 [Candidatus Yanofskybacteria bacterium RIFCSPHIGHO2_01_FULL_43_32]OGN17817.1 MAG: hypothetical protein A3E34_01120 [Candidatus Yanofskybacteria bacterium RIFCSPHIGHO2_12_FULL_43_11]OGN24775.1 MAG: hypothetical protein A2923_03075 [Candidatus Yanofskybacteria bacterium RIFCSPLOWO2_01_FULL_43_46]OGN33226.1 MAG: hypothetical protein A3G51_02160 [Candidatus Yanofskybacteria bacterium RIFCSPLOWO2_12_FULL_43_11b]
MQNKDYYNILGVQRNASEDEIKKAFRKLAHEHHPDKKTGNEAKFKEINEAYQILSDPKKRSNYDNFGFGYSDGGFQQGGYDFGGQGGNFWDFFGGSQGRTGGAEDLFEMFSDVFGGFRQPQQEEEDSKGENLYLELTISKKDLGTTKTVEYDSFGTCDECAGQGVAKGYKIITCNTCHGTGQIRYTSRTAMGMFTRIGVCGTCRGKGRMPEKECSKCKGAGRVKAKKKLEIRIPENLENNYNIVIPKGGNTGKAGKMSGDLVLNIRIK